MATSDDNADLDDLDYSVLVPYNGTGMKGANPLDFDVNVWYEVSLPTALSRRKAIFTCLSLVVGDYGV